MSASPRPGDGPGDAEGLRTLRCRLDELERRFAWLVGLRPARPGGEPPCRVPAPSAARRPDPGEDPWSTLERRVEHLARLLHRQERRSAELAARLDGHDESIRMLCLVLKRLDDPYGMGEGLDERLGLDGPAEGLDGGEGTRHDTP